MSNKRVNYSISWTQLYTTWHPVPSLLEQKLDQIEAELTDFSDAQKVLQKIMSM
jgi:hypothetical protein